ncbi:hypothetical protein JD276_07395 [Leucobacter sp. CSA1]|uniref:LysM domain-containing protein n=1 Tax=Leucobacter chromiisoli TaxID=2796471 RepID=A0A934Q7N4_9MICO|nr:hypothetical protein [Leucobacter chromiisoli]MBK0418855.1 hypothetical protein [Leucobacter chromiisoli]
MTENKTTEPRSRKGLLVTLVVLAIVIAAAIVFGVMQMTTNGDSTSPASNGTDTSETEAPGTPGDDDTDGAGNGGDEGTGDEGGVKSDTRQVLPKTMGGQDAIEALGDDIDVVAERNGMTVDELKELLLRDKSAKVSKNGFLLYP